MQSSSQALNALANTTYAQDALTIDSTAHAMLPEYYLIAMRQWQPTSNPGLATSTEPVLLLVTN